MLSKSLMLCIVTTLLTSCTEKKRYDNGSADLVLKHSGRTLARYNFGALTADSTRDAVFTVKNIGKQLATISSFAVVNRDKVPIAAFQYTGGTFPGTGGTCATTLAPESECNIALTFTAPRGEPYARTVTDGSAVLTYRYEGSEVSTSFPR